MDEAKWEIMVNLLHLELSREEMRKGGSGQDLKYIKQLLEMKYFAKHQRAKEQASG